MSHVLKKKQVLMISHMLVMAAWEFVPQGDHKDRGRRIPSLICTAPLSRALVANVFVQTRKPLEPAVVDFFLHDKVIPAFRIPIAFVYCVLMDRCDYTSPKKLISTVQRISATMPHIQTLDLEELPEELGEEEQQLALAAALPKRLWSLRLISLDFCFGADFVTQLAEICPLLERLDLQPLDPDACELIFSSEKNLFPHLKTLSVWTASGASSELFNQVFASQVVSSPRLESLEFSSQERIDQSFPAPSLKPLERLHNLGSILAYSVLSTVPDFSVLSCCSELNKLLEETIFVGEEQVVVDLSTMPNLTSLGPNTLNECEGVHTLVLPPTLRTVGEEFCARSTVQNIDFSLCAESLRFVDTVYLLAFAGIESFSTLPLRGKIGTVVGHGCFFCSKLQRIDLSGLQGIEKVGDYFLSSTAVEDLDLISLGPTCTKIGTAFLSGCESLKKVTGCDGLRNVVSVGNGFLSSTANLSSFDFAAMQGLETSFLLTEGFLHKCPLQAEGTKILEGIVKGKMKKQQNEQQPAS